MTRSESITNGSGEHAKCFYSVGKKIVDQAACTNSGRALTLEVTTTVPGMSAVDPEGGDSFFMFRSFALVFDATDFDCLDCLVGLGLTWGGVFRGVGTLPSDALSKRTN